jgi:hypothetical protein
VTSIDDCDRVVQRVNKNAFIMIVPCATTGALYDIETPL